MYKKIGKRKYRVDKLNESKKAIKVVPEAPVKKKDVKKGKGAK